MLPTGWATQVTSLLRAPSLICHTRSLEEMTGKICSLWFEEYNSKNIYFYYQALVSKITIFSKIFIIEKYFVTCLFTQSQFWQWMGLWIHFLVIWYAELYRWATDIHTSRAVRSSMRQYITLCSIIYLSCIGNKNYKAHLIAKVPPGGNVFVYILQKVSSISFLSSDNTV